jgi:hypothetical protein
LFYITSIVRLFLLLSCELGKGEDSFVVVLRAVVGGGEGGYYCTVHRENIFHTSRRMGY